MAIKVLAFSGSGREGSYNQRLVRAAAKGAQQAGAQVTLLDLRTLPLPIFDEDLEKRGTPDNAKKLKQIMFEHQAFLIASPEYNSSVSALLKNAIDWASRPAPGEVDLQAFKGKVAGLLSASPGNLGGLRGLVHLRAILGNIAVLVIPEQFALSKAHEAFDESGNLKDAKQQEAAQRVAKRAAEVASKLLGTP